MRELCTNIALDINADKGGRHKTKRHNLLIINKLCLC